MRPTRTALLVLLLLLLLAPGSHAASDSLNLTLEASQDPVVQYKCFLPPSQLDAAAESRIYIEGGGVVGGDPSGSSSSIEITGGNEPISGTGRIGEGRGTGEPSSREGGVPRPKLPGEESLLYGQLLDEQGRPLGGEEIEITWVDATNRSHRFTTTTLTREEATRLGDPDLEGYYFISKERVGSNPFSVARLPEPETEEATVTPENATPSLNKSLGNRQPAQPPPTYTIDPTSNAERAWERLQDILAEAARLWWLLPLGFLLLLAYLWRQEVSALVASLIPRRHNTSIGERARKLYQRRAKELARRESLTIVPDHPVRELLGQFLGREESYALVEERGELRGVITADDILRKGKESGTLTVKELMSAPAAALPENATLGEAIEAAQEHRILPLLRNKRVVGVITREALLEELDRFFSLSLADARDMPTVKEAQHEGLLVHSEERLLTLLESYKEREENLVLVTRVRSGKGRHIKDLVGYLDERLLLDELYNYSSTLEKMDAGRVMKGSTRGINEGSTLFEANKVMLELETRSLPVLYGEEVVGVISGGAILRAMHQYLQQLYAAEETRRRLEKEQA